MSKLNSQKPVKQVDEVPEIEPAKPKKAVEKVPEIEEEEEEDLEEEDDEDENGEVPEIAPKKAIPVESKPNNDHITQQRAEEIQILQNNGVFRVELLYQLGQLNQNIVDLNTLIAGVIENARK